MSVTPLPSLDRTDPTFKTDVDTFFATELPTFSVEVEALRVEVLASEADAAASALASAASATASDGSATASEASAVASAASATAADVSEAAAAASAASALNAPGTSATSTTSLTIGSGAKSLTIQTGKLFTLGQTVVIARTSDPIVQMTGAITAHNSGTGALSVTIPTNGFAGSGTYADWTISLSGAKGEKGDTSSLIRVNRSSNTMLTAADNGKYFNLTSSFLQTFDTPSNLGNGWFCYIRNVNTDGVSAIFTPFATMYPEEERRVDCDGTTIRSIVINPFKITATASSTFFKTNGYSAFGGLLWGGGASGMATRAAATSLVGGGAAGCTPIWYKFADMPSSVAFTIGAGGAAVTATAGATVGGNDGGNSTFGVFTAYGGMAAGSSAQVEYGISGSGTQSKPFVYALYGPYLTIGGKPAGGLCAGAVITFTDTFVKVYYQRDSVYGGGGAGYHSSGGGGGAGDIRYAEGGSSVYGGAGTTGSYVTGGTTISGAVGNSVYGGIPGQSVWWNGTNYTALDMGVSSYGGTGGAASFGTGSRTGTAGGVRGGGGGCAISSDNVAAVSGAGGRGELQLWGII